jgi:hypothetical protein
MAKFNTGKRLLQNALFAMGLELRRIKSTDGSEPASYSFCNEEAIIQELLGKIKPRNKFVVDIGAADGEHMSNSYKLFSSGWSGVGVEFNGKQFAKLAYRYSGFSDASLLRARVTPHNVLNLLAACETPKDFGFLSLDIDSYDYFVLEQILSAYRPSLICTEINEKIPPPVRFTVKWYEDYSWNKDHFFGQSLAMAESLAKQNQYDLVQLEYNNAFFIPHEINPMPALTAADAWRKGYVDRPDRLQRFPWNKDVEPLINMPTQECVASLHERFKGYNDKFILE